MTWTYDSGLPSPMRTLVRNAVIAKLAPLTRSGGGWLEAVIPIGFSIKGPHDELGIDLLWQELNGRTPAIAVATTRLQPDDGGAPDTSRGHLTFELYLVSSHRRGVTAGRTEADVAAAATKAADPGLDAALELAWMYLLGVDLGIGPQIADPRFVEEDEIVADNEKTIWQQTWRVWLTRDVDQLRASVQKLTGLRSTFSPDGDEPAVRHIVVDSATKSARSARAPGRPRAPGQPRAPGRPWARRPAAERSGFCAGALGSRKGRLDRLRLLHVVDRGMARTVGGPGFLVGCRRIVYARLPMAGKPA